MRLLLFVDNTRPKLSQELRNKVADELRDTSDNIDNPDVNKIFRIAIYHIRRYDNVDVVHAEFHNWHNNHEFVRELPKDFLRNMCDYVQGKITDNGYNYSYNKPAYGNGGHTFSPQSIANYMNQQIAIEDKSETLKNIRTVEKIVSYHDNDWKVVYSISMDADESYIHKLEISDHNDPENKTSHSIRTDSHFIKALDQKIKDIIEELENNLWTIDRFEKWSGDLSG